MENISSGVIYIHSAPQALCRHIEWALGTVTGEVVSINWQDQPAQANTQRGEYVWSGAVDTGAAIASALRGWEHLRFEVTEDHTAANNGGRWMHTPDLGIFYAQTDVLGDIVVPEARIRSAMALAGIDPVALQRELGLALGSAWDAELEVFRTAQDFNPVVWLHRVG